MKRIRTIQPSLSLLRRCLLEDSIAVGSILQKQSLSLDPDRPQTTTHSRVILHPWRNLAVLDPVSFRWFSAQPLAARKTEEKASDQGGSHSTGTTQRTVSASALDVDKAIEDYDKVLDKHRERYLSRESSPSTSSRIWEFVVSVWKIVPATWNFTVALPGVLYRATTAPWSVKKAWMQHQWKHIKDGAHHYWVTSQFSRFYDV